MPKLIRSHVALELKEQLCDELIAFVEASGIPLAHAGQALGINQNRAYKIMCKDTDLSVEFLLGVLDRLGYQLTFEVTAKPVDHPDWKCTNYCTPANCKQKKATTTFALREREPDDVPELVRFEAPEGRLPLQVVEVQQDREGVEL